MSFVNFDQHRIKTDLKLEDAKELFEKGKKTKQKIVTKKGNTLNRIFETDGNIQNYIWSKSNKFIFFYISCGVGAAILQSLMYYFNIQSITSNLLDYGVSNESILEILKTGTANPMIFEYVSQSKLAAIVSDYNSVMVGASGAIYGVLVAFTFMYPNSKLMLLFPPIPVKAKYLIPLIIAGDIFFGFTSASIGPIAHFAHIGGAVTGFFMMWYWKKNQFNKNRWN